MGEDLAALSNDEIRLKLIEYGFQNLPVTQTTRKILVKKLQNAIDGQKTKVRRETVAVIKSSDDEDISEKASAKRERTPNRRATIGIVEKTKKVPASSSTNGSNSRADTPSKTTSSSSVSRRSSRATPQKIVSSTIPLQEDSDDNDVIEIPVVRRSKTPTMAKSETVRTSYKSTVEKVAEEVVETESSDNADYEKRRVEKTVDRRRTFAAPEVLEKPVIRTATPTKFGRKTLTTSIHPSGSYNFNSTYSTYAEKSKDEDDDADVLVKEAPYLSNFAKRLSTLKAEPIDSGLGKYKALRKDENNDDDDDYYYGGKANKYESATTYQRYSQYGGPSTSAAGVSNIKQRGVVSKVARDFEKMDRKYNVRKFVYIALLIMIVIAIYVLLFV